MYRFLLACIALSFVVCPSRGDVLELKSGEVLDGKFAGGTASTLRFEDSQGVRVFETAQIIALTFTTVPVAAAESSPPAAVPQAAPPAPVAMSAAPAPPVQQTLTIPAGTPLLVRMMDSISSENKPGTRFTTTLEQDLVMNNVVLLKAGTKIYGELRSATKAGRAVGKPSIDIRLNQVALGSEMPLIATSAYKEAGASSGVKTVGSALVGAGVGAAFGGGKGAGKGAAVGGAASLLVKGDVVTVPPNMLLEFQLTQPLNVTVSQEQRS